MTVVPLLWPHPLGVRYQTMTGPAGHPVMHMNIITRKSLTKVLTKMHHSFNNVLHFIHLLDYSKMQHQETQLYFCIQARQKHNLRDMLNLTHPH